MLERSYHSDSVAMQLGPPSRRSAASIPCDMVQVLCGPASKACRTKHMPLHFADASLLLLPPCAMVPRHCCCCAGASQHALVSETSDEVAEALLDINTLAPIRLTQAVLPHMIKRYVAVAEVHPLFALSLDACGSIGFFLTPA